MPDGLPTTHGTALRPRDRSCRAKLRQPDRESYETRRAPELDERIGHRLSVPESPIRGFGVRLDNAKAPPGSSAHPLFHAHAGTPCEVCYLQGLFVDAAARRYGGQVGLRAALWDNQTGQYDGIRAL